MTTINELVRIVGKRDFVRVLIGAVLFCAWVAFVFMKRG